MIHIVFLATDGSKGFQNFIYTLDKFCYSKRHHLGYGEDFCGWKWRMKLYYEQASKLPPNDLVICTDADDVLALRSQDHLKETFLKFKTPIVVSAEIVCGGNCVRLNKYWKNKKRPHHQYVNGGGVMGYAKDIAKMYKWMLNSGETDDQRALGNYVNQHSSKCSLDSDGNIFWVQNPNVPIEIEKVSACFELKTKHRKNTPFFAHFPGQRGGRWYTPFKTVFNPNKRESRLSKIAKIVLEDQPSRTLHEEQGFTWKYCIIIWVLLLIIIIIVITWWYRKPCNPKKFQPWLS